MRQTLDNTRFGSFFKPDFAKKSPQTPKISPAARSALAVRPIAALSHHFGSRAALVRVSTPSFLSQHLVSLGVSTPLLVSQHLPLKADLCLNVHSQALESRLELSEEHRPQRPHIEHTVQHPTLDGSGLKTRRGLASNRFNPPLGRRHTDLQHVGSVSPSS